MLVVQVRGRWKGDTHARVLEVAGEPNDEIEAVDRRALCSCVTLSLAEQGNKGSQESRRKRAGSTDTSSAGPWPWRGRS